MAQPIGFLSLGGAHQSHGKIWREDDRAVRICSAGVSWLSDTKAGGAFSYNTETSPGPAIPTKESLAKFIPKEHLWPIDEYWNFHAGEKRFTNINIFSTALTKRYGAPTSLDDFERKAQAMTYENQRAMFEAYGRNKHTSTGVIQWMLNNAWPSLIWHLYDYYLVPAGGYSARKRPRKLFTCSTATTITQWRW